MNSADVKLLAQADPILEKIILQIPKPVIESTGDVFHDLMSCIVEQQIHYRSSKGIFKKALERAGIVRLTTHNFHLFEEFGLPAIKLSQNKLETIFMLLEYWQKNSQDFHNLTDEEVYKELSTIKGIGKWSIDMILLYTLQRPNVFPYDDFHLKQLLVTLYGLDEKVKLKAQMTAVAEKWQNNKSLACLYLLAWKQQNKSK